MATAKKDYAKIARERMYRPGTHGRRKKPKWLIYARNKKGKSTFLTTAGVDNIIILDPEYGVDDMAEKDPHVWPVLRWEDVDDFYQWIRTDPVCPTCTTKHKFAWIGIDGLTRLANMSLKYVMRVAEERDLDRQPGMVQQRDYGKSGELMKQMLTNFHNLDKGVIYTCHERQDAPFQGEEDEDVEDVPSTYVPDLPKGGRGAVNGLVDVTARLYVVNTENDAGERVAERRLWLGPSDKYDTGYRSDYKLPDQLRNPTVPKLLKLIRSGQSTTKKKRENA